MPKDKDNEPMPYGAVRSPGEEESVEATERAARQDRNKPEKPFLSPGEVEAVEATEEAEEEAEKQDDKE